MLLGKLANRDNDYLYYRVPIPPEHIVEKQLLNEAMVYLSDGRAISPKQRAKAYALLRDISAYTGHHPEELKEYFKYSLISRTACPDFSLSDCEMTVATQYIELLIEFCLEWSVPCQDSLLESAPDIGKYLYLCLYHKKCCICGKQAEVHHHDRVGIGRNRREIAHIGMHLQALCRKHHNEAHLGQKSFDRKHYVFGIAADELLVNKLNLGKGR